MGGWILCSLRDGLQRPSLGADTQKSPEPRAPWPRSTERHASSRPPTALKSTQRLDYNRLAEALGERGLVEPQALQHILTQCLSGGGLFTEILVAENHISDWDLSRVVCEVFGLPFLTPEFYTPSSDAAEGIELAFLHEHAIVPLDRFGKLLTIAMPGLTPSNVLGSLRESIGVSILPVVSSVVTNRAWLQEKLPLPKALGMHGIGSESNDMQDLDGVLPEDSFKDMEEGWSDLFDEGNAAVLLDLESPDELAAAAAALENIAELGDMGDMGDIEDLTDIGAIGGDMTDELASLETLEDVEESEAPLPDLPQLPELKPGE